MLDTLRTYNWWRWWRWRHLITKIRWRWWRRWRWRRRRRWKTHGQSRWLLWFVLVRDGRMIHDAAHRRRSSAGGSGEPRHQEGKQTHGPSTDCLIRFIRLQPSFRVNGQWTGWSSRMNQRYLWIQKRHMLRCVRCTYRQALFGLFPFPFLSIKRTKTLPARPCVYCLPVPRAGIF
jgi:hypothetical protein